MTPGETHNHLTALHLDPSRRKYWIFLCSCGREVSVRADRVTSGNTKSCGHLRSKRQAAINANRDRSLPPIRDLILAEYSRDSSLSAHEIAEATGTTPRYVNDVVRMSFGSNPIKHDDSDPEYLLLSTGPRNADEEQKCQEIIARRASHVRKSWDEAEHFARWTGRMRHEYAKSREVHLREVSSQFIDGLSRKSIEADT